MQNLLNLLGAKRYPTSQEIMASPVKFKRETLRTVKEWKSEQFTNWKTKNHTEKLAALYALITKLSQLYNKPVCVTQGGSYCYLPLTKTIGIQEGNYSIISTLHEFAHHIFGSSEKQACRWSVWLFKKVFPKSFAKLRFAPNSHMLIKVQNAKQ